MKEDFRLIRAYGLFYSDRRRVIKIGLQMWMSLVGNTLN